MYKDIFDEIYQVYKDKNKKDNKTTLDYKTTLLNMESNNDEDIKKDYEFLL